MLEWSVEAARAAAIDRVVVVLPMTFLVSFGDTGVEVVAGGATRSESVRNGLVALGGVDRVVVHDAARPLVEPVLFTRCLAELDDADAAIAAARVTDTIKEAGADRRVSGTLDRSRLWAVQTPQAFRGGVLARALAQPAEVLRAATDDAMLVERIGGTVRVVESEPANFKVTTHHDLEVADLMLSRR